MENKLREKLAGQLSYANPCCDCAWENGWDACEKEMQKEIDKHKAVADTLANVHMQMKNMNNRNVEDANFAIEVLSAENERLKEIIARNSEVFTKMQIQESQLRSKIRKALSELKGE